MKIIESFVSAALAVIAVYGTAYVVEHFGHTPHAQAIDVSLCINVVILLTKKSA